MRIVADGWYAEHIPDAVRLGDSNLGLFQPIANRVGVLRGVALAIKGRNADAVVTGTRSPGALTCIVLYGLLGIRKLVLLEFIMDELPQGRLGQLLFRKVCMGVTARALLCGQVLTEHELRTYPELLGIPQDRLALVRWPARFDDSPVGALNGGRRVVASGERVDWVTFFGAAEGSDWDVHAICTAANLGTVETLARGTSTVVRHDIPAEDHQAEVDRAAVYVVPIPETGASIGQKRIMNAAQAGAPLVITDVVGSREYVDDSCAVLVPPEDPDALRTAVNMLLDDRNRSELLRNALRSRGRNMAGYLDDIAALVVRAVDSGSK